MTARISKKFSFYAAIHQDGNFISNVYDIELYIEVMTDDVEMQNIAMDRIKYLFDFSLDSCIFVDTKEVKAIDLYSKAGIQVCPIPDEPYDQVIAAVILNKLNVITENHMLVTEIKIQSDMCDDVCFYIGYDEQADFLSFPNAWWTENSPNIATFGKKTKKDKIVELKKEPLEWAQLGLGWKGKSSANTGEIVFIPMPNNCK